MTYNVFGGTLNLTQLQLWIAHGTVHVRSHNTYVCMILRGTVQPCWYIRNRRVCTFCLPCVDPCNVAKDSTIPYGLTADYLDSCGKSTQLEIPTALLHSDDVIHLQSSYSRIVLHMLFRHISPVLACPVLTAMGIISLQLQWHCAISVTGRGGVAHCIFQGV